MHRIGIHFNEIIVVIIILMIFVGSGGWYGQTRYDQVPHARYYGAGLGLGFVLLLLFIAFVLGAL